MTTSGEIRLRGPLKASDLFSLEQYARQRGDFRGRVLEHKKARTIAVGPNSTWIFEDRLTVDQLPLTNLIGPAVVVDVRQASAADRARSGPVGVVIAHDEKARAGLDAVGERDLFHPTHPCSSGQPAGYPAHTDQISDQSPRQGSLSA